MAVDSTTQKSEQECPLCMETLDLDDKSFYPCTCGYQICRFCWHRILSESSIESTRSCPACRKTYSDNPANFKPLSVDEVQLKLKQQRKLKEKKNKTDKKSLQDLRVVQKNLVFVVGITGKIADAEVLKTKEYFGKFGKIHKVVVNCVGQATPSTPSGSYGAYITYTRSEDALRAIQSVNNVPFDGKTIKASLGTTKYCSHFLRNQVCPKPECMYLHCQGDPEASFTKEDMQAGRHQEYERRLLDEVKVKVEESKPEKQEIIVEQEEENNLDFDPFYETQKNFEAIINEEICNYEGNLKRNGPPPGFHEEWIDPAIIYSSQGGRSSVGHLLGNSLLEDIFSGGGGGMSGYGYGGTYSGMGGGGMGGYYVRQPPPGFDNEMQVQMQQGSQYINNNFFNQFPF